MQEEQERRFTGIWIPAEIWLNKKLSTMQKVLFAEIDSFDKTEDGCTASDDYFSSFLGIAKKNVQVHLHMLRTLGYIKSETIDGRRRSIRSLLKLTRKSESTSPAHTETVEHYTQKSESTSHENVKSTISNNKDDNKDDNKEAKSENILTFGALKIKEKKYKTLIKDYGEKKVKEKIEDANNYFEQIGLKKAHMRYKDHGAMIANWLRREGVKKITDDHFNSKKWNDRNQQMLDNIMDDSTHVEKVDF